MLSDAEYAGGKICSSCDATGMAVNLIILSETYYVRVLAGRRPKIAQCLLLRRGGGRAASGAGETMKYDPGRPVGVKHPRVLQFYPPPKHCRAVYNTLRKG